MRVPLVSAVRFALTHHSSRCRLVLPVYPVLLFACVTAVLRALCVAVAPINAHRLGFREPDPNGIHYQAILSAVSSLAVSENIEANEIYVWLDCKPHARDPTAVVTRAHARASLLICISVAALQRRQRAPQR